MLVYRGVSHKIRPWMGPGIPPTPQGRPVGRIQVMGPVDPLQTAGCTAAFHTELMKPAEAHIS